MKKPMLVLWVYRSKPFRIARVAVAFLGIVLTGEKVYQHFYPPAPPPAKLVVFW